MIYYVSDKSKIEDCEMRKNHAACLLRAIEGTKKPLNIGLFRYQDIYRGFRLFAVYVGNQFVAAFPERSQAVSFSRSPRFESVGAAVVLFEAKGVR